MFVFGVTRCLDPFEGQFHHPGDPADTVLAVIAGTSFSILSLDHIARLHDPIMWDIGVLNPIV